MLRSLRRRLFHAIGVGVPTLLLPFVCVQRAGADVWVTTEVEFARAPEGGALEARPAKDRVADIPGYSWKQVDSKYADLYRLRSIYGGVERIPWAAPYAYDPGAMEPYPYRLVTVTTSPSFFDRMMQVAELGTALYGGVQHALAAEWLDRAKLGADAYGLFDKLTQSTQGQEVFTRSTDVVVTYPNPDYDHVVITFDARSDKDPFNVPEAWPRMNWPEPRRPGDRLSRDPIIAARAPISLYREWNTFVGEHASWPKVNSRGEVAGERTTDIEHSWYYRQVVNLQALVGDDLAAFRQPIVVPFVYYVQEEIKDWTLENGAPGLHGNLWSSYKRVTHAVNLIIKPQEQPAARGVATLTYVRREPGSELGGVEVARRVLWQSTSGAGAFNSRLEDPKERLRVDLNRASDGHYYVDGARYDEVNIAIDVESPRVAFGADRTLRLSGGPVYAGGTKAEWSPGAGGRRRSLPLPRGRARGDPQRTYRAEGQTNGLYRLQVEGLPAGYDDPLLVLADLVRADGLAEPVLIWGARVRTRDCDCATGTVVVPDVVGQSRADALQRLTGARLTTGETETETATSVPAGYVASQDPVAGTRVPEQTQVTVKISRALPTVAVPKIEGLGVDEARRALETAGLLPRPEPILPSPYAVVLKVQRQSPPPGSQVPRGTPVSYAAKPWVAVPDLKGRPLPEDAVLKRSGLHVSVLHHDAPNGLRFERVATWYVSMQVPMAGMLVEPGSGMEVWVQPAEVLMPSLLNLTRVQAEEAIESSFLVSAVGRPQLPPAPGAPAEVVTSQSPQGGTPVAIRSTVSYTLGQPMGPDPDDVERPPPAPAPAPPAPAPTPMPRPPMVETTLEVPDVRGMAVGAAKELLKSRGLLALYSASLNGDAQRVRSQIPAAGSQVRPKSIVQLTLEPDVADPQVPEVRGLQATVALQRLQAAGFQGRHEYRPRPTGGAAPGTVLEQDPRPGERRRRGSTVTIWLQPQPLK